MTESRALAGDPHLGVLVEDDKHIFHLEKKVESQSDVRISTKSKPVPEYKLRQTSEEWTKKKFCDQVSTPSQMETPKSSEKFGCMMPPQQSICKTLNLDEVTNSGEECAITCQGNKQHTE